MIKDSDNALFADYV